MAKVPKRGRYNLLQKFSDRYGHPYSSQQSLVLWMEMTPNAPADRTNTATTTVAYTNSPVTRQERLPPADSQTYWAATFNDSSNQEATATNADGAFDFTSLADGGTPTATSDRPFSFSCWAKLDDTVSSQFLFTKRSATNYYEYRAVVSTGGVVNFTIREGSGTTGRILALSTVHADAVLTQWTHYGVTYDGRGSSGGDAEDGMNIYINGQNVTDSRAAYGATYVGMKPDFSENLYIGADYNGTREMDGQMAEVAAWSTALTPDEVQSIYNATLQGSADLRSGILNNPPRTILRALDCATGSYPTVSRLGDTTRLGRYATSFDDRNTIVFASGSDVTLSLPLGIQTQSGPVGRAYMSQSVATPNLNSTLEAFGTVRKGVADANIHLTPGEDFAPFKEDGLYVISKDARVDPFYMTGSRIQDVGPGFSQPLGAKTKIVFDLTANVSSAFGFYPASGNPRPHLMSYFDHDLRKWVPTGEGFFNSAAPPEADVRSMLENNCLGFGPTQDSIIAEKGFLAAMGLPVSTYGFPSSARYHATSSCAWPLSGVLDRPFVAEKFVYEFSASYECRNIGFTDMFYWDANENGGAGGFLLIGSRDGPSISSFFILNQRGPFKGSVTLTSPYTTYGDPNTITEQYSYTETLPTVTGGHYVDTTRDLVTYGQIHMYPQTVTWPTLDDVTPGDTATVRSFKEYFEGVGGYSPEGQRYGRELNVGTLPTYNNTKPMVEGRFIMSGTMKVCGRNEGGYPLRSQIGVSARLQRMNWESHGRNLFTMNTGRDLARAAPGQGPAHPGYRVMTSTTSTEAFGPPVKTTQVVNSPYLLKPSDSLIFGWQVPPSWNYYNPDPGPSVKKEHWIELAPGPSRLTIYGSEVADNREHHPGLNQHLTSDAVHELVGFHGPPLDQFDTEFRSQYSGSYISNQLSGSIGAPNINGIPASRRVVGDRSNNRWLDQSNPTVTITAIGSATHDWIPYYFHGAVKRASSLPTTTRMADPDLTFYDCYYPTLLDYWKLTGYIDDSLTTTFDDYYVLYWSWNPTHISSDWWGVFPFEPKFSTLPRRLVTKLPDWTEAAGESERAFAGAYLSREAPGGVPDIRGLTCIFPEFDTPVYGINTEASIQVLNAFMFGTGASMGLSGSHSKPDFWNGLADENPPTSPTQFNWVGGNIRGFRYGLMHTKPQPAVAHFRRSSFGQFRDMLEQRPDSVFINSSRNRKFRTGRALRVRFTSPGGQRVKPSLTDSSNLSIYATSSLPYFEDQVRNRGPINTAEQGTTIVSI